MVTLVCGRCGHHTAPNSTYCSHCRWTLCRDIPGHDSNNGYAQIELDLPRGLGGFLERRRVEHQRAQLERTIRTTVEERIEDLEGRIKDDPANFELHRSLGEVTMLANQPVRAYEHWQRAHQLNGNDFGTNINYAIVLSRRGQWQPAIDLLQKARTQWPDSPIVLYNLALVALQARRAELVLETVDALEQMWLDNITIATDYHEGANTARGLALSLLGRHAEAKRALAAAASHTISKTAAPAEKTESAPADDDPDSLEFVPTPENPNLSDDEKEQEKNPTDDIVLEGKSASADLLNNLALAEVASGDVERAVQRLQAAMRLEPGHARVHNNLGVLAYQQGRFEIAAKYLSVTQQIEEFSERTEPATQNNMAVILSAQGSLDEALELFQHAGQSERAEFEVFYNLGRAYIEHGKPDRGVEYLRRAFTLDPNHSDVHTVLGAAYLMRGQNNLVAEALKHLKRALQLNTHHRVAFADLAMTMLELENEDAARKVLSQALKAHPRSAEANFLAAIVTMDEGTEQDWAAAAGQFHHTLELRPDLISGFYNAALCQYLMGFRDAAAQQLHRVTQLDPSFAPAYYLIGVGYAVAKKFDEALKAWQQALKYEPDNPDLQANMGYIYYQRQQWDKAIKCYMAAHRLVPGDADLLAALGLCFARDNKPQQAVVAFTQSLSINPRSPVTHSNIGLAYYIQKQVENAIDHWRLVSQIDARYAERRQEEQQKSFDDSQVSLRPLNWRSRIVKLAPVLPRPHTRLLPGYNAQEYRPALQDPAMIELHKQQQEMEKISRSLAWMNVHIK